MVAKSHREDWHLNEAEGYAPAAGMDPNVWKLGKAGHFRLVIPEVLRIEGAPKGARVTAKAISRADDRLTPIRFDGEWMLWGWNPIQEEPFLVSVEYWLLTRAEVFRRFAAQAQEAAAAAAALADKEADDEDGMDRTLDANELMPDGIVFMVARPFPAVS